MKLPNGYGSVINLGKKRRKPFAVRVTVGKKKNAKGQYVQEYKYLGYFEKSKDAHTFLAQYNSGVPVKEYVSIANQETFKDLYEQWYDGKLKKNLSESSYRSYEYSFNLCKDLHDKKMVNLRLDDLQNVVNQYTNKSKTVVTGIKTLLFGLFELAMKKDLIEKDYSKLVDYEYTNERFVVHTNFTEDEIKLLWDNIELKYVDYILVMIYMGWRAQEFCELKNCNVHLDERYIIGGKKTKAGTDRIVPIHKKILPIIEKYYDPSQERLFKAEISGNLTYKNLEYYWNNVMSTLNMKHLPHDTRYTTATLLDRYGANKVATKKILGHKIQDITDGIYTQKELPDLLEAIDVIPM